MPEEAVSETYGEVPVDAEALAQYNKDFFTNQLTSYCLCHSNFDLVRARAARVADSIKKHSDATERTLRERVQATFRCPTGEYAYLKFDHDTALTLDKLNVKWLYFRRPVILRGERNEECRIELDDVVLEFRITEYETYGAGERCTPIQDPVRDPGMGPLGRMVELTIRPLTPA